MEEPLTEELLNELLSSSDPRSFFESHEIRKRTLSDYLQELLDLHGLERAVAIRRAGLNETYGYQLFAGQRVNPSRDKVLQLVFGMGHHPQRSRQAYEDCRGEHSVLQESAGRDHHILRQQAALAPIGQ